MQIVVLVVGEISHLVILIGFEGYLPTCSFFFLLLFWCFSSFSELKIFFSPLDSIFAYCLYPFKFLHTVQLSLSLSLFFVSVPYTKDDVDGDSVISPCLICLLWINLNKFLKRIAMVTLPIEGTYNPALDLTSSVKFLALAKLITTVP